MKTCPKCKIQVGGPPDYCPLCQSQLVGAPEPPLWPKTKPEALRFTLLYKLVSFVLLAGAVICVAVDLLTHSPRHWSVLVIFSVVSALLFLRLALRRFQNVPRLLFQVLLAVSAVTLLSDWYLGYRGFSVDWVIPILCTVTLILNFVLAFVPGRLAENGLVYLLMNIVVGVVPYVLLLLRRRQPIPWVVCLLVSILTFLGLVIFRGRALRAELQKRLHL